MEKEKTKKETEEVVMTGKEVLSDEMLEEVAGGTTAWNLCVNGCKRCGYEDSYCYETCARYY